MGKEFFQKNEKENIYLDRVRSLSFKRKKRKELNETNLTAWKISFQLCSEGNRRKTMNYRKQVLFCEVYF